MSVNSLKGTSAKPKAFAKAFVAAAAAAWFLGSDEDEKSATQPTALISAVPNGSLHNENGSMSSNRSSSEQRAIVKSGKLSSSPPIFLGRPLCSFTPDRSLLSAAVSSARSRASSITVHDIHSPIQISGRVYNREFQEIDKLGSGAYGSVYRSKNCLDGNTYAVKKIILPKPPVFGGGDGLEMTLDWTARQGEWLNEMRAYLREAQVMATVCKHRNIVRYHQSWIEVLPSHKNRMMVVPEQQSIGEESVASAIDNKRLVAYASLLTTRKASLDDAGNNVDDGTEWCDDYTHSSDDETATNTRGASSSAASASSPSSTSSSSSSSEDSKLVLFIQMELCHGVSLYDWLRMSGRTLNAIENRKLFKQLLAGLEHLHSNGYCHRDVKPANLLIVPKIGRTTKLKVGDFGCCKRLSDPLESSNINMDHNSNNGTNSNYSANAKSSVPNTIHAPLTSSSSPSSSSSSALHTQGCGTFFYMAPELHTNFYDEKVDIFAAGVVLFELFNLFETEMERHQVLTQLHEKRLVPHSFVIAYPNEAYLVLKMTHSDPAQRPSAFELLNNPRYGFCQVEDLDTAATTISSSSSSSSSSTIAAAAAAPPPSSSTLAYSSPSPTNLGLFDEMIGNSSFYEEKSSILQEKEAKIREQQILIETLRAQLAQSQM